MNHRCGFTLIELSIVLVIIGLIAGGVLVGRDLIQAAEIRATVSQIQKYEAAVNTFRTKYNYLPGDIPADQAAQTGLIKRGGGPGDGNGDGYIETLGLASQPLTSAGVGGETVFFWTDLSSAGLIEGSFTDSTDAFPPACSNYFPGYLPPCDFAKYFPLAKVGTQTVIMAFHNNLPQSLGYNNAPLSGLLFELISLGNLWNSTGGAQGKAGLTTYQAYAIDSKIDDGMPLTGSIRSGQPGIGNNAIGGLGGYEGPLWPGGTMNNYCVDLRQFAFGALPPPNLYQQEQLYPYNVTYPDRVNCNLIIRTGI